MDQMVRWNTIVWQIPLHLLSAHPFPVGFHRASTVLWYTRPDGSSGVQISGTIQLVST
jgi:hypothetical protein